MKRITLMLLVSVLFAVRGIAQNNKKLGFVADHYYKIERMIPMRDGVRLFTAVYIPKDNREKYPFLMERTPYSCAPYGEKNLRKELIGPDKALMYEKYIFVYQDVRGRYKSEGNFVEMTPVADTSNGKKTDEGTDTYDTIDWLLKNIPGNNGRVGIYGISYPGFYSTASLTSMHPALKAVSPQAPVTDEFIGDDAYHNGAFYLMDNFDFTNYFQGRRTDSGKSYKDVFDNSRKNAYQFFMDLEPLTRTNSSQYFNGQAPIWNEYLGHDTYDAYWQARDIRRHLKNIAPAVLIVGGWFDAEDLFGSLHTYEALGKSSPGTKKWLIMGPWTHGAWSAPQWDHFVDLSFNENLNQYYQDKIEAPFFNYYLKSKTVFNPPTAIVYETGANTWKQFASWPPAEASPLSLYFGSGKELRYKAPDTDSGPDVYTSDPANPVPYSNSADPERYNGYMAEDQRFLDKRTDVLSYKTDSLTKDITVTGRVKVDLFISTTGTDADLILKLIDVYPDGKYSDLTFSTGSGKGGYEQMVRAEVFRCKFRNSYEHPEALNKNEITEIRFELNDIAHQFKKGHRIMIQVQSSWFPLVDINPQQFLDIPNCDKSAFKAEDISLFHDKTHSSQVLLPVIP